MPTSLHLVYQPGLSAVAIATLAFGIGGATAIFSVADAVILRPLPFVDAERLVVMWQANQKKNQPFIEISYPAFRQWREQARSFEDIAGMPSVNFGYTLMGRGEPTPLHGRAVSGGFFSLLGTPPILGRTPSTSDELPGAPRVVVLSHALWRDQFSSDASVVGQSVTLGDKLYTVVGVMPPGFAYPKDAALWTALPSGDALASNDTVMWMIALGRLRLGVSLSTATAEMSGIARRYNWERSSLADSVVLTPMSDVIFGSSRPALFALLAAVFLVLLIACSNVAGLLLVSLSECRGELAVRQVLGASVAGLALSFLVESLVLAGFGGLFGLLLAHVLVPSLVALAPADVFRLADAAVDMRAFLFSVLASLLTALLCSLAPSLLLRRMSLETFLRSGARGVVSGRSPLRSFLVVSEVALALVLLVGAGLLFRSFLELRSVPLGFEPSGLLSVEVGASEKHYPDPPAWRAFHSELIQRVRTLPGVSSAASVTLRPLWGTVGMDWPFWIEGQSKEEASRNPLLNLEAVSPDYFRTMGIPVRRGRVFTDADATGQPGVVVVSESLARRYWPDSDPIGKRLMIPLPPTPYDFKWLSVGGVVSDARYRELQASRLDLYMSFLQADHRPHHMVVRFAGDPSVLASAIRAAVRSVDPDQPVTEVVLMSSVVSQALGGPRFAALLFSCFALVALLLAALGLYGLLSFSVSRRTREIGVRVAVGATPSSVHFLVLREGLLLAALGIAVGLFGAAVGARVLSGLLFAVRPIDPLTFLSVPVVLLSVAALACVLPASRATRVDAAVALRSD